MLEFLREPLAPLPFVLHTIVFLIGIGAVFIRKQRVASMLLGLQAAALGAMYLALGVAWGERALFAVGALALVFGGWLLPLIVRRFKDTAAPSRHPVENGAPGAFMIIFFGALFLWFAVGQFAIFFPVFRESVLFVPFDLLALSGALLIMARRTQEGTACFGGGFFIHGALSFVLPLAPFAPVLVLAVILCLMIVVALLAAFSGYFTSTSVTPSRP